MVEVGSDVASFKTGDLVIPSFSGWGTWRTQAITKPENLVKIPNDLPVVSAATLSVNPCTVLSNVERL